MSTERVKKVEKRLKVASLAERKGRLGAEASLPLGAESERGLSGRFAGQAPLAQRCSWCAAG